MKPLRSVIVIGSRVAIVGESSDSGAIGTVIAIQGSEVTVSLYPRYPALLDTFDVSELDLQND